MKKQRIGIFGGTFSPPHNGHVRAASAFLAHMNPPGTEPEERMKLFVMPAALPPHKTMSDRADPEIRLAMCRAAFGDLPDTEVSDYEITRGGISYTVLTLEHYAAPDRELWLFCGEDMFLTLDRWFRAEEIFSLARIAAHGREIAGVRKMEEKRREYEERFGKPILLLPDEPLEVSSTRIRELAAAGEDLGPFVPPGVAAIIRSERLYGYGEQHDPENAD